jgi:ferredoxin
VAEAKVEHEVVHEAAGRFACAEGRPVLDAGLEAGLDLTFGCRVGVCGACAVEVVEGACHLDPPGLIEADSLARFDLGPEVRLACRLCIRGPLRIRPA